MMLTFLIIATILSMSVSYSYNRSSLLYARSVASMLPNGYDTVQATVAIKNFLLEAEYKLIGPLNIVGYITGIIASIWLFTYKWYYPIVFVLGITLWLMIMPIFRRAWIKKLRLHITQWQTQNGIRLPSDDLDAIEGSK